MNVGIPPMLEPPPQRRLFLPDQRTVARVPDRGASVPTSTPVPIARVDVSPSCAQDLRKLWVE